MDQSALPRNIRPLTATDIERVIEIDASYALRSRRGFFERRLAAALAEPRGFVYVGHDQGAGLDGYILARLVAGEFGQAQTAADLDAVAVAKDSSGQGIGRVLLAGLEGILRHKGVGRLRSEVDWRNGLLTEFFAATGFVMAPRHILERDLSQPFLTPLPSTEASAELDFSDDRDESPATLARDRYPCRPLQATDLPAMQQLGERLFGYRRDDYYRIRLHEALEESGVRVSLAVDIDDRLAGFIMARTDFGEFGRSEPAAVIDTIEVDPGYAHHHVGSALLGQLCSNLGALRIDAARTEVAWNQFDLLAFLDASGFRPSQHLALERRVF